MTPLLRYVDISPLGDQLRSYMDDRARDKGSDQRARESVDSLAGRIEAKQERISFDDETINTSIAATGTDTGTATATAKGAATTAATTTVAGGDKKNSDNFKTSSSSGGNDNKPSSSSNNHHRGGGDVATDDRSMYSSSHVDDDSLGGEGIGTGTGTGTLSFAISDNASEYNDHNNSIAIGEWSSSSQPLMHPQLTF